MALESERSDEYAPPPRSPARLKRAADEAGVAVAGAARNLHASSRQAVRRIRYTLSAAPSRPRGPGRNDKLPEGPPAEPSRAAQAFKTAASASSDTLVRWFKRQPVVRFVAGSLLRRILVSNLIGFSILVLGILYLGWVNTWLIDAKVDAENAGHDHRRRLRPPPSCTNIVLDPTTSRRGRTHNTGDEARPPRLSIHRVADRAQADPAHGYARASTRAMAH